MAQDIGKVIRFESFVNQEEMHPMRNCFLLVCLSVASLPSSSSSAERDKSRVDRPRSVKGMQLQVSPNGRYFVDQDGKPFFYLGDTAWLLFQRLNREEVDEYLKDRAAKGF